MRELALSSWSVHRGLGATYPGLDVDTKPRAAQFPYGSGTFSLLDLPAAAASRGIRLLEVCHFHFPRTDPDYLAQFRAALAGAGVVLQTVLVDEGDISSDDTGARAHDLACIRAWIDLAHQAGARQVRVSAGRSTPSVEAARRSSEGLAQLSHYAAAYSMRILTENWQSLSMHPPTLLDILAQAGPDIGLCADFGNYKGPEKYASLRQILPRATSVHCKGEFPEAGRLDEADVTACLDLARGAGFDGPYVLIFDGPGDEWTSIEQLREVVRPYIRSL